MVRRRTSHQTEDANEMEAAPSHEEGAGRNANRAGRQTPDGMTGSAAAAEAGRPTMQRAEELADRLGEKIGHYATLFGHQLLWLAARAREEAEDIWAEAQEIRHRRGQSGGTTAQPSGAPTSTFPQRGKSAQGAGSSGGRSSFGSAGMSMPAGATWPTPAQRYINALNPAGTAAGFLFFGRGCTKSKDATRECRSLP